MVGKKAEPLQVVHPDSAGVDVGKRKHYVAVRNLSTTLRHRRLGFTEQAVGSQPRPAG